MSDRRLTVQEMDELEQEARRRIRHPDGVGDEPMALNPVGVLALLTAAREGERLRDMIRPCVATVGSVEQAQDDEAWTCLKCNSMMRINDECDPPEEGEVCVCNSCAQELVQDIARAALAGKGEG